MLQSLTGDHVHSPCHNQIPPTSPSDKKRQKKKKEKKRVRPGENNLISFKSYHGVLFFFREKHDFYYLELFVSGQSQLCDSKLASKHVLLARLKLQPSSLYEFR